MSAAVMIAASLGAAGVKASVRQAASSRAQAPLSVRAHRGSCRCVKCSPRRIVCEASSDRQRNVATNAAAVDAELTVAGHTVPSIPMSNEMKYMVNRINIVHEHFENATSKDDFLFRLEMALNAYGFTGENSIAIANMCRDDITAGFKYKIEQIFPLVFNINGLGGGITAGVIGMGAGLSHSPVSVSGKKRYVFFSFPHIAITSHGVVGSVGRPGQDKPNFACGALIAALGQLKAEGLEVNIKRVGTHIDDNPEYSILKQRIARRMLKEDLEPEDMDLVDITKLAERQITADLEYLISEAVDPKTADYAIVTGIQIHNWSDDFDDEEPNLEFIEPTGISVVINGERTELDLSSMPAPSARQLRKMVDMPPRDSTRRVAVYTGTSTVTDIIGAPLFNQTTQRGMRKERDLGFASLLSQIGDKNFKLENGAMPADDAVL